MNEQEFHPGAPAIAKDEDSTLERTQAHRLLHQDRQAVDPGTKVDRIAMKVDAKIVSQPEHDTAPAL